MLSVIEKAARAAGAVALSYFRKETHITRKTSHQNLVTKADTTCQALIKKIIIDELMKQGIAEHEIGFIGEEKLEIKGAKHLFIIDPIDGTNNFASGLGYFSVAIAHIEDGQAAHSVIYWPAEDTLYYAKAGEGAFKKEKVHSPVSLHVKDELLENCLLLTYLSGRKDIREKTYHIFEKIFPLIRALRIRGSSCLDLVHLCDTENAAHIVLIFHGWLWDIAAGYLIVKESGGIFTDFEGNKLEIDYTDPKKQYSLIAAHSNVIKALSSNLS
jgi:myo-inositol-1(or 4)-monophosphatase